MDAQLPFSAPQSFTDPDAALAHARAIYDSAVEHLRDQLRRFVAGETPAARLDQLTGDGLTPKSAALTGSAGAYTRSNSAAIPCPPPMHIVTRARLPPVRCSS